MRVYLKLSKQYMKKNLKTYLIILIALILTVFTISFPTVLKRSQGNNKIKYINEIAPKYDLLGQNIKVNNVSKLKNSDLVKNVYSYNILGSLSKDSGFSSDLNSYNEKLFEILNYKIVKGDYPKHDGEIILNENTYISGKKVQLGKEYNFFHEFKYKEDGTNKIISGNYKFKVVGLYKSTNSINIIKYLEKMGFDSKLAYTSSNTNLIPDNLKICNVFIDKINNKVKDYQIAEFVGVEQFAIAPNDFKRILTDTVKSKSVINNENRLAVIAVIMLILSVFIVSSPSRMKFTGTIEIIGGNKKKLAFAILFEYLLMIIVSTIVGGILTYSITSLLLNISNVDITGIKLNVDIPYKEIYLTKNDLLTCAILNLVCILFVYILQMRKIIFTSPIVLSKNIRKIHKISIKLSNLNIIKNIKSKLAFKWVILSFRYYIIPMIIICAIGSNFINVVSTEKSSQLSDEVHSNVYAELIGRNYILKSYSSSDKFGIDINLMKNYIKEYKLDNVAASFSNENYFVVDKNKIEKGYFEERLYKTLPRLDGRYELSIENMSLDDNYLKYLKEKGLINQDDIKKLKSTKEIGVILVNDFYSKISQKNANILKNIKQGDCLKLKLPVLKTDRVEYKIVDVKVIKIIPRNKWIDNAIVQRALEGNIGMSQNVLQKLSNVNCYNHIVFDGNKIEIENMIQNKKPIKSFILKDREKTKQENIDERRKIYFAPIILNYMILIFTILAVSKMVMEIRIKDFNIMKNLGASEKYIKTILKIENILLSVMAFSLSLIIATYRLYKNFNIISKLEMMEMGRVYSQFILDKSAVLILFIVIFGVFAVNYQLLKNKV